MPSDQLHDSLMAAVEEAWGAGSRVAGQTPAEREQIVQAALRRWGSFSRRSKRMGGDTLELRTEDLAKGLRDRVEQHPSLTGPLMSDYRWLAGKLAAIFSEASAAADGS